MKNKATLSYCFSKYSLAECVDKKEQNCFDKKANSIIYSGQVLMYFFLINKLIS